MPRTASGATHRVADLHPRDSALRHAELMKAHPSAALASEGSAEAAGSIHEVPSVKIAVNLPPSPPHPTAPNPQSADPTSAPPAAVLSRQPVRHAFCLHQFTVPTSYYLCYFKYN